MDKKKQKIEGNFLIHLSKLLSIIDKKSLEFVNSVKNRTLNYNLWLGDSNLILTNNIKYNKPLIDIKDYSNDFNLENKEKLTNKKKNIMRIYNDNNICNKFETNISDFMIRDFFKEFFLDLDNLFQISPIGNNQSETNIKLIKNDNIQLKTKIIMKNEEINFPNFCNFDKNHIDTDNLSEKIKSPLKNILSDVEINTKNYCNNDSKININLKNKRERDSNDNISSITKENILNKQIKFQINISEIQNNDEINLEKENIRIIKDKLNNQISILKDKNIKIDNKYDKYIETSDPMDIENGNNIIFSNNFKQSLNDIDFKNYKEILISRNEFESNHINNNIIIEQPSREQDISVSPQTSISFIPLINNHVVSTCEKINLKNNKIMSFCNNENLKEEIYCKMFDNKKIENENNISINKINKIEENNLLNKFNLIMNTRASNFTFCNNASINNECLNTVKNSNNQQNLKRNLIENNHFRHLGKISSFHNINKNDNNFLKLYSSEEKIKFRELKENSNKNIRFTMNNIVKNEIIISDFSKIHNLSVPEYKFNKVYLDYNTHNEEKIIKQSTEKPKKLNISKNYEEDNFNKINFDNSKHNTKIKEDQILGEKIKMNITMQYKSIKKTEIIGYISEDMNKKKICNIYSSTKNEKKNDEHKNDNFDYRNYSGINKKVNYQNKKFLESSKGIFADKDKINENQGNPKKFQYNFNEKTNYKKNMTNIYLSRNSLSQNFKNKIFASKKNEKILKDFHTRIMNDPSSDNIVGKDLNQSKKIKENNYMHIEQKIKDILKLSSYDESLSNNEQNYKEKLISDSKKIIDPKISNNNQMNLTNVLKIELNKENKYNIPNSIQNNDLLNLTNKINSQNTVPYIYKNLDLIEDMNENLKLNFYSDNLQKIILADKKNANSNNNYSHFHTMKINNIQDISNQSKNIEENVSSKNLISIAYKDKNHTPNFDNVNFCKNIENKTGTENLIYELTDETPGSSDYDDSNYDCLDIDSNFLKKKKNVPQWARDKPYIKCKIFEQIENPNLSVEIFGKRKKIEYLDLKNIFSTACSNYDIRGESADWKIDNTMSSRRYNRFSRHEKNIEEIKENNEEQNVFSNFKKTSRNLFNDFNHNHYTLN